MKVVKNYSKINKSNFSRKTLDSYLAIPLSKVFDVSEKAMEISLSDLED